MSCSVPEVCCRISSPQKLSRVWISWFYACWDLNQSKAGSLTQQSVPNRKLKCHWWLKAAIWSSSRTAESRESVDINILLKTLTNADTLLWRAPKPDWKMSKIWHVCNYDCKCKRTFFCKWMGLPNSQLELVKPLGWKVKHLQEIQTVQLLWFNYQKEIKGSFEIGLWLEDGCIRMCFFY